MRIKKDNLDKCLINNYIEKYAITVRPLFSMYGWNYGDNKIPDVDELTEVLADLVMSVLDSNSKYVTQKTGRFGVTKAEYDDETELNIFLDLGTIYEYEFKNFKVE